MIKNQKNKIKKLSIKTHNQKQDRRNKNSLWMRKRNHQKINLSFIQSQVIIQGTWLTKIPRDYLTWVSNSSPLKKLNFPIDMCKMVTPLPPPRGIWIKLPRSKSKQLIKTSKKTWKPNPICKSSPRKKNMYHRSFHS